MTALLVVGGLLALASLAFLVLAWLTPPGGGHQPAGPARPNPIPPRGPGAVHTEPRRD